MNRGWKVFIGVCFVCLVWLGVELAFVRRERLPGVAQGQLGEQDATAKAIQEAAPVVQVGVRKVGTSQAAAVQPVTVTSSQQVAEEMLLPDQPGFRETAIYKAWRARGVTDEDIRTAVLLMREAGADARQLRDPNLIDQRLPARDIPAVAFKEIILPQTVAAGAVVPFSVSGVFPDPSYRFEEWVVVQADGVTEIEPRGMKSAETVSAVEVPVSLDGVIGPFKTGETVVVFKGIGQPVQRTIRVE